MYWEGSKLQELAHCGSFKYANAALAGHVINSYMRVSVTYVSSTKDTELVEAVSSSLSFDCSLFHSF